MEQPQSPYNFEESAQYSPSVYTESGRGVSPDRPYTPSSFECYITIQGGRSSATELSRFSLQKEKGKRLTDNEEYMRAIFNASFLQAENAWLRRIRKSAVMLFEDTVQPTTGLLAQGAEEIHEALMRFHLAFSAVDQAMVHDEQTVSSLKVAVKELVPVFELCREGLEKVRAASCTIQKGEESFSEQISEWNRSYSKFFGINYTDTA